MIDMDRLYTQEEIDELDLFNEDLEFGSVTSDALVSESIRGGLVDYPPSPPPENSREDWEDKKMKFGKYKGESLLTVSQDTGYCDWMIKQDFHWNLDKDKHLRDMLNGYLRWKQDLESSSIPQIDNTQLSGDLSNINPLSIDTIPWLIEARPEFAPVSYTDVGKWLLFFPLFELAERWKQVKYFYHRGFLEGVFQIKCSTAQDNPRASDNTSGVIALCCCDSYEQERIKAIGWNILDLLDLGDKTIYYKTDQQSREGTRVTQKRNHIYKLP